MATIIINSNLQLVVVKSSDMRDGVLLILLLGLLDTGVEGLDLLIAPI